MTTSASLCAAGRSGSDLPVHNNAGFARIVRFFRQFRDFYEIFQGVTLLSHLLVIFFLYELGIFILK